MLCNFATYVRSLLLDTADEKKIEKMDVVAEIRNLIRTREKKIKFRKNKFVPVLNLRRRLDRL